jgi:hypothetical protein
VIEIRKSVVTLGSIICLFVLVFISYQPVIATQNIQEFNNDLYDKSSLNIDNDKKSLGGLLDLIWSIILELLSLIIKPFYYILLFILFILVPH